MDTSFCCFAYILSSLSHVPELIASHSASRRTPQTPINRLTAAYTKIPATELLGSLSLELCANYIPVSILYEPLRGWKIDL